MGGIELERPLALLLLLLPLALLFLVRFLVRPETDATGTIDIWRRAAMESPVSAARARRRIPPAIWFLCASLSCCALAVAGLKPRSVRSPETLLVVVDRSPSMYLQEGPGTRLDRALALASEWLSAREPDSIRWITPPAEPLTQQRSGSEKMEVAPSAQHRLRDALRMAPLAPRPEPDFSAYDRASCLWITDRVPADLPQQAGYACSGGRAVPGPVGVHEGSLVDWDGNRLVETKSAAPKQQVEVERSLPTSIARVARAWAQARGYELTPGIDSSAALTILGRAEAGSTAPDVVLGRDGWSAHAIVEHDAPLRVLDDAAAAFLPLETWLTDESGQHAWVTYGDGAVFTAFASLDRVQGDPAAFAVSWSKLFDACVLPPPACVSLNERLGAGEPGTRAPHDLGEGAMPSSRWPAAWSLAALVLALVALALRTPMRWGAPSSSSTKPPPGVAMVGGQVR